MTDQGTIWLTQEAYDKLQAELEDLKGPVRQEIIEQISAARDEGDLKENGGYHAAKDEQGKLEARIRQLEDMLRRAEVGETPADDGVVEPGMVVTVPTSPATTRPRSSSSAPARSPRTTTLDVYSPQSAMGAAIIGKPRATTVDLHRAQRQGRSRSRSSTRSPTRPDRHLHRQRVVARRPGVTGRLDRRCRSAAHSSTR